MATDESTRTNLTKDDAIDEANEQTAKESRWIILKRSLVIAAAVTTSMLLIYISMRAFTGGFAISLVLIALLPVVALFVQIKRKKWDGRPIADLWQFWQLAVVPMLVMSLMLFIFIGFNDPGRLVAWWFGEEFSTSNLFPFERGFFGKPSPLVALGILLLGVTGYAMMLRNIAQPYAPPSATRWIGRLVLLPVVATLPLLIVIGMGVNNSMAGF